jgi:hypothetical protein
MIDGWLKDDLERIFEQHPVAVLVDVSGDAEFLLGAVEGSLNIHHAHSEIDELHIKYLIERARPSKDRYLIYTRTPRNELKFIREYCETSGCLEISYLENYIKDKVHKTLNLNINLPKEELIAAAKVSVGKDQTYWMDLIHKGAVEIFDLEKELLPFIHDPAKYEAERYDAQLREVFYRKVNDLLGQAHIAKPAGTLAGEVVKAMLDGLARGECHPTLEVVYHNWLDSVNYRGSLPGYLDPYSLPPDIDIWATDPSHPFLGVDEQWLKAVGKSIGNKGELPNILARIARRIQGRQAQSPGISFWPEVKLLLEFDPSDITYLNTFAECAAFYTKHFYKLDTAIRKLYAGLLNKRELLEPFQEHYKQLVSVFLDQWFKYFDDYQEGQTGLLQRIISENKGPQKVAVIVGDGVAYEIACCVAKKVSGDHPCTRDIVLADIPSETANNMSRIYMDSGATEGIHQKREKYLAGRNPDLPIGFARLEDVNEAARPSQFLICTYKDIDEMGEKLQQHALKYFEEVVDRFAAKVTLLLKCGYSKVYLISDHGFVLTGLLSEADKVSVALDGEAKKAERYIRTAERQPSLAGTMIEAQKKQDSFNYLYFSKTLNPFKTPGVYGFSHGGVSPQELVTPYFCWERSGGATQTLAAAIQNKAGLKSVTGEIFQITIQADTGPGDLFSMQRKVYLVFFSGGSDTSVNTSDFFTIQRGEAVTKEYTFAGNTEMDVLLLDASTKEQLDRAVIKQNMARDLGGLL